MYRLRDDRKLTYCKADRPLDNGTYFHFIDLFSFQVNLLELRFTKRRYHAKHYTEQATNNWIRNHNEYGTKFVYNSL